MAEFGELPIFMLEVCIGPYKVQVHYVFDDKP